MSINTFAQQDKIVDSLLKSTENKHDSLKISTLTNICWILRNSNPEKSIIYGKQAIALATKFKNSNQLIKANSFVGVAYRNIGNYGESFDYYFSGLKYAKQFANVEQEGYSYINIGNLYIYQDYFEDAIENLIFARVIAQKTKNQEMLAYSNLNIGRAYLLKKDYSQAINYLKSALQIRTETKNVSGQASCYKYLGDVYSAEKDYKNALLNYIQALATVDKQSDKDLYSALFTNIAKVYYYTNDYNSARSYADKSLETAKSIGTKLRMRDAYSILSKVLIATGQFQKASEYQTNVILYNDSLFNQQLSEKISNLRYSAEKQKKQAEINLLNKNKELDRLRLNRQTILIISFGVGFLLLLVLLIFGLYSRNKIKQSNYILKIQKDELKMQNIEIHQQREEIQTQFEYVEKQRDHILFQKTQITASIQAARRIQQAIFEPFEVYEKYFKESFIIFKPRDIVSGDFFKFHKVDNKLIFVVADCVGHGVPGAFMTLIGNTFLEEIVSIRKVVNPVEILNELDEKIIKVLKQKYADFQSTDSIDISVLVIDIDLSKAYFSGAKSLGYFIRNNEITELEGVKYPVGTVYRKQVNKDFKCKEITLENNDVFYLFSDGYPDQMGGESNRKFMIKHFRNLLFDIHHKPMSEQLFIMQNTLKNWQGDSEQIDDILVFGLKIIK